MRKLTKEQVIILHEILIKHTGGTDGIRDIGLLESALETPFITLGVKGTVLLTTFNVCSNLVQGDM